MMYRSVKQYHAPPLPAAILGTSGLFVLLAMLAEWQPGLAMMLAAGFDIAAFLNVASNKPTGCTNSTTSTKPSSAKTGAGTVTPASNTTTGAAAGGGAFGSPSTNPGVASI